MNASLFSSLKLYPDMGSAITHMTSKTRVYAKQQLPMQYMLTMCDSKGLSLLCLTRKPVYSMIFHGCDRRMRR